MLLDTSCCVLFAASLLPTGSLVATVPSAVQLTAPAAQVQIRPVVRQAANGQCAAVFAVGQQCGGNLTNALTSCSDFNSCTNIAWAGGCCPAQASCTVMESSGSSCWACGGKPPPALAAASEAATNAAAAMCNKQANGDFDYSCALSASMLFYEAQRSGRLPAGNRTPWRGNSALLDKAPNGASIVGGW